jgi:hypothetical protein
MRDNKNYMFLVLLLGVVALLGFSFAKIWLDRKRRNQKGPFPYPFLGNTLAAVWAEFRGDDRFESMEKLFKTYGKTYTFDILGFRQISTIDPDNIRHFVSKVN